MKHTPTEDDPIATPEWFGHPRGLSTLFFTELWERFSYYGMRGILVLFMTNAVTTGGLGMTDGTATAIYGLYTAGVYLAALPGGWIADRLLGQRNAVLLGGIIIALGHFTLAVPTLATFYLGLLLIVTGTGLLKPNVSAIVGDLYPEGGARRDAGFSLFYMGINIGAFAGPLVCGYLGEEVHWHLGFAAAGIGMVFGLLQYVIGWKHLGDAGGLPEAAREGSARAAARRSLTAGLVAVGALALVGYGLIATKTIEVTLEQAARGMGVVIVLVCGAYFLSLFGFGQLSADERRRLALLAVFFVTSAIFWAGFEQAGSSMNLFAERLTERQIGEFEIPASWLQSVNPLFIILLAPVFGWLWVQLGSRNPSMPAKFAYGLISLGIGFLVVAWASSYTTEGKVSPMWLVVTYFFHTAGELCLSPVGLSSVTKLSPRRLVSRMMGIWFCATALGNLIAGLVAGEMENLPLVELFGWVAGATAGTGLVLLAVTPFARRLAGDIR